MDRRRHRPPPTPIAFTLSDSRLGTVLAARSPRGLCAILLGDDPAALIRDLETRFPSPTFRCEASPDPDLARAITALVHNPGSAVPFPLDPHGTPFQRRVWEVVAQVPTGRTTTYAEVAQRLGAPGAARAVAQACGANPLAVVVPCHRVVRQDGAVSGYRWGVERKRALLQLEAAS